MFANGAFAAISVCNDSAAALEICFLNIILVVLSGYLQLSWMLFSADPSLRWEPQP